MPATANPLIADRGLRARKKYYKALEAEVAGRGVEEASVAGVIRRVGGSKGGFYHHFRNKEDLVRNWYRDHTMESVRALNLGVANPSSIEKMITDEVTRVVGDVPSKTFIPTILRMMVTAIRDRKLRALFQENYLPKVDLSEQAIAAGIRSGEFRPDTDSKALALFVTSGIFGIYLFHYLFESERDLGKTVELYLGCLFAGARRRSSP